MNGNFFIIIGIVCIALSVISFTCVEIILFRKRRQLKQTYQFKD